MDNASKALIIAGGILISIAVIGLAMYVFQNAKGLVVSSDTQIEASQIQAFNRYYKSLGTYDEKSKETYIDGADAFSIYNKITNNNAQKQLAEGEYEFVKFNGPILQTLNDSANFSKSYSYSYHISDITGLVDSVSIVLIGNVEGEG